MDPIKELRLRSWARTHYVPPSRRSDRWHPVVLDEMSRKDADLAIAERTVSRDEPGRGPRYVPLGYVPLMPDTYIHRAHDRLADPKLLARIESLEQRTAVLDSCDVSDADGAFD